MSNFPHKNVNYGSIIIERSAYLLKIQTDKYESDRKMFKFIYYVDLDETDHIFFTKIIVPITDNTYFYIYPLSLVIESNHKSVSVSIGEIFNITMENTEYIPQSIIDSVHEIQNQIKTPNINAIIPLIPDDKKIRMIEDCVREIKENKERNDNIVS